MWDLPFWSSADEFNQIVGVTTHLRYLLLITRTHQFQINQDIKSALKINKKPNLWFIEKFRALGARVEYVTAFTVAQKRLLGPTSERVSSEICKLKIKARYSERSPPPPVLVCNQKDFFEESSSSPFEVITTEDFVQKLLLQ